MYIELLVQLFWSISVDILDSVFVPNRSCFQLLIFLVSKHIAAGNYFQEKSLGHNSVVVYSNIL